MGAIVTLDLPDDSPAFDMPWIITFGPDSDEPRDDEVWEPVVCGPYVYDHAFRIAHKVVDNEDLLAVVEPLQPHTKIEDIKAEIVKARELAAAYDDEYLDDEPVRHNGHNGHDHGHDDHDHNGRDHLNVEAKGWPTPDELREGFVQIAARLSA